MRRWRQHGHLLLAIRNRSVQDSRVREVCQDVVPWVEKFGGTHHGYFLPHEGANNIAIALFSFPSLAAYEEYRTKMKDAECQAAFKYAKETRCIVSYERSFMRPVFE